jgi:hypothetical protein
VRNVGNVLRIIAFITDLPPCATFTPASASQSRTRLSLRTWPDRANR